jgi:hypothetical protein
VNSDRNEMAMAHLQKRLEHCSMDRTFCAAHTIKERTRRLLDPRRRLVRLEGVEFSEEKGSTRARAVRRPKRCNVQGT